MSLTLIPGTVIITGAGKGIGSVIALKLAEIKGIHLSLISRSHDSLFKTVRHCESISNQKVNGYVCDLSSESQVNSLKIELDDRPVTLINNAGSYIGNSLLNTSLDDLQNQMESNLFGAFNITKYLLPHMLNRKRGLIITIGSIASVKGLKRGGAYAASKHALLGWGRSLRDELKDSNIGVTTLNIGPTWSSSWEGSEMDPGRIIKAEDIAQLVYSLILLSEQTVVEEMLIMPQKGDL